MIDRLNMAGNLIQSNASASEVIRKGPTKAIENNVSKDQSEARESQYNHPTKKKVEEVVKGLNNFLEPSHTSLRFKFHEKLNKYYVTIVDDVTDEVVKEIPVKRLLDLYADMAQHLGLLVDKRI